MSKLSLDNPLRIRASQRRHGPELRGDIEAFIEQIVANNAKCQPWISTFSPARDTYTPNWPCFSEATLRPVFFVSIAVFLICPWTREKCPLASVQEATVPKAGTLFIRPLSDIDFNVSIKCVFARLGGGVFGQPRIGVRSHLGAETFQSVQWLPTLEAILE